MGVGMKFFKMKRVMTLVISFMLWYGSIAQEKDQPKGQKNPSERSRVLPAQDQVDIWALNFGMAYMPVNDAVFISETPGFNFNINYHYEILLFFKPEQSISFGIGYEHIRVNHNGRFLSSSNKQFWENGDTIQGFQKGNLRMNTVKIPLEYRIRFKQDFKLYLGYNAEYLIGHRDVTFISDEKQDIKRINSLRRLLHGANLRLGYKDVFLFGGVNFSGLINHSSLGNEPLFRFGVSVGG